MNDFFFIEDNAYKGLILLPAYVQAIQNVDARKLAIHLTNQIAIIILYHIIFFVCSILQTYKKKLNKNK